MSASTSSIVDIYSRRLLLHPLHLYNSQPTSVASPPSISGQDSSDHHRGDNSLDANVVMVLSVLLCAIICSLAVNFIIRCAIRCSSVVASDTSQTSSTNAGIKKKALKKFTAVVYSSELNISSLDIECAICLSDFSAGERVRLLPKCNHGFHVKCIDKWLSSHSSCPKCRQCLMETCQKVVGCHQAEGSSTAPQAPVAAPAPLERIVPSIAPLEREGLERTYREN